jgi:exopolysaccharide biosynthesis polyprenyl glycosylphosphotransferase
MQLTLSESALRTQSTKVNTQAPRKVLALLPSLRGIESLMDFCTICFSFALACDVSRSFTMQLVAESLKHLAATGLLFSCMVVLFLDRSGAYRSSGGLLRVRETACVLEASAFACLLGAVCVLFFGGPGSLRFIALTMSILVSSLLVQKHLLHSAIDSLRESGYGLRRVLIYGAGPTAKMLFSALSRSPKLGMVPVAIIADEGSPESGTPVYESGYRRRRSLVSRSATLRASLVKAHEADVVIVATRPNSEEELRRVMDESAKAGATVAFAADSAFLESTLVDYVELDDQLVYSAHKVSPRLAHHIASRTIELLVGGIFSIFALPLFGLISLLIKLDSPGPVLFRQQRVGKDGELFTIFKFRSMHWNKCSDGVSPGSPTDSRITRVGRWLRKTSLDELPQFINILRGEMALVGPRPEMPFIVNTYTARQRQRLSVRPGLTGLWQISADRCLPIHENIQYDLYYIKNRSVFMDIAILFHTTLFAMKGI